MANEEGDYNIYQRDDFYTILILLKAQQNMC